MNRRIALPLLLLAVTVLTGAAIDAGIPAAAPQPWRWTAFRPLLPRTWVKAVRPESAAAAAIDTFLPSRSGDPAFEQLVARALVEQSRRIPANAASHARSTADLRKRLLASGLPEVFVGIPYIESGWSTDAQSPSCAGGPWQFLPEVGVELGLRVEQCRIGSGEGSWLFTPTDRLPPDRSDRPYLGGGGCRISGCVIDERRDLAKATEAALDYLATLYQDPAFPAADRAIYAITAYNAGPGGVARWVERGGDDPLAWMPSCADGRKACSGRLSSEGAWYAPRVVAAAALASCTARDPYLADWGRADLCSILADEGWTPKPLGGGEALALVARSHKAWTVGLLPMQADPDLAPGAHELDAQLLEALGSVKGVKAIAGVPGEDPADLVQEGADVVIAGEVGETDGRPWVRFERWQRVKGEARPTGQGVFRFLEDGLEGSDLLADALLHPAEGTRATALAGLLEIQRPQLEACVEAGSVAALTLDVQEDGHPRVVRSDPGMAPCFSAVLAGTTFPPELAGARARFDLGIDGLADAP